jgi:hypothetical protein
VAKTPLDFFEKDLPQLIVSDSFPITGFHAIGKRSTPISTRKPVFPKTFDRLRQFRPKTGQPATKWLKLPGESEIDGVLELVPPVFFRQAQSRPWFGGKAGPKREPASIKIVWAA